MSYTGVVKVTNAESKGEKDNPHGGVLYRWNLNLEAGGEDFVGVFWQRKSSDPISVGDQMHGEISKGEYGWRFKLTQPDGPGPRNQGGTDAPARSLGTPGVTGGSAAPGDEYWAERNARIERQHSQEMALRLLGIRPEWLTNPSPSSGGFDAHHRAILSKLTDFFATDIGNASSTTQSPAKGTGGEVSTASPPEPWGNPPLPAEPAPPWLKGKITTGLKENIAEEYWESIKDAYKESDGSITKTKGLELLRRLDGLDKPGVGAFLREHGIAEKSDVPWGDEGPNDEQVRDMGLEPTDEED